MATESVSLRIYVASLADYNAGKLHGVWIAYCDYVGTEHADEDGFTDAYNGEHDSEKAFAEEIADDCLEIPEAIANYFDYEAFARDLFRGDYFNVHGELSESAAD